MGQEIWKDIVGYEGRYQVSNLGRVKSLDYKRTGSEGILKEGYDGWGYPYVNLRRHSVHIHRLVATHFIENDDPEHKTQVNHRNRNVADNRAENLEWCTPEYNVHYDGASERRSESAKRYWSKERRENRSTQYSGKGNPNYGKRGRHWFNDGTRNILALECPDGFVKGFYNRKYSLK